MKSGFKVTGFFCALAILLFSQCGKDVDGKLSQGEIALNFDDNNVKNWYEYLPLLDSLNIKATFYICRYHQMNDEQKQMLHEIERDGHEIAYHTSSHPDLVKLLQNSGMAPVINDEIKKDLHQMREDGFNIKNFAYPYGSNNIQLDCALKPYFKTIRKVCNNTNWNKSLVQQSGDRQILYGAGIDANSGLSNAGIISLLNDASNNHDCVVLTAHEINTRAPFKVTTERLRLIAAEAEKRNLKFVTIDRIRE